MGLVAGLIRPRVDAHVKAGLLELVAHAQREGGESLRKAAATLGGRPRASAAVARPRGRRPAGRRHAGAGGAAARAAGLGTRGDRQAGRTVGRHRLLASQLAHRGSRLGMVYVSESTVLHVLVAEGVHLPERPARQRRERRPFPEWAELVPGVIWIYDFTHFAGLPGWCAIAVLDVVLRSGYPPSSRPRRPPPRSRSPSPPLSWPTARSTCWTKRCWTSWATASSRTTTSGCRCCWRSRTTPTQMTSKATAAFMAGARIAQHFGRPGVPNDQAWIESFFAPPQGRVPTPRHHHGPR